MKVERDDRALLRREDFQCIAQVDHRERPRCLRVWGLRSRRRPTVTRTVGSARIAGSYSHGRPHAPRCGPATAEWGIPAKRRASPPRLLQADLDRVRRIGRVATHQTCQTEQSDVVLSANAVIAASVSINGPSIAVSTVMFLPSRLTRSPLA